MKRCIAIAAALLMASSVAVAQSARKSPQGPPESAEGSVEKLLKEGWEITGYASNFDGRTLILFKHKDHTFLNQCSVFYDVTREKRVIINCYEVR